MRKFLALLLAVAALIAAVWAFLRRFLPKTQGLVQVPGLRGPVEIIRDAWGVPHIYADHEEDLFFAQGYVHAQDRLWQMELQRRAGAGRLSEILGEPTLEVDRMFRILGLNRAAEAEAALLQGETKEALEAYSAGVNAYIAREGRLSLEFALLRFKPEPWRPVDSLYWAKVMANNLSGNWVNELIRARLTRKLGAGPAADLEPGYPADNPPCVVMPSLGAATAPQADGTDATRPSSGWRNSATLEALKLVETLLTAPTISPPGASGSSVAGLPIGPGASNQWVLSGRHTDTGKPLLANDTHMPVAMPSIWYQVHLAGGRYHVAGVSFPGVPGVIVGHNERCAWGMTTAWQDCQDLYVEKLNPDNPQQYEFEGQWHNAQIVTERIQVKGRPEPVEETVMITRHGPIISGLVGEETPLALRWVALDPTDVVGSALRYDRASNWEEFREALAAWAVPSHNFVYADVDGNIAFMQAGWMPVRAKGHGIAPVPGWSGEYEWERYLTLDELPQVLNPESGWIVVANNLVADDNYGHFLSADLENPCRAQRILELVEAQETVTASDCLRFQRDTYSDQAERFVRHLLPIQPTNTREHQALTYLREWDYRLDGDSVAATLYQVCRLRALHLVFDSHLDELVDAYVGLGFLPANDTSPYHDRSFVRLLEMLDNPSDSYWLKDSETGIPRYPQELLHMALRQALKLLRESLGDDMAQWTWGRCNRIHFSHPVGSVKPLHLLFNRGPYPMPGDRDTLLRAVSAPKFPQDPVLVVDALLFIADLSDWERCRIMVPGGQSGHVASKHYADLIPLWREGVTLSLPFNFASVKRQMRDRLVLVGDDQ